eukprot:m.80943 g.80943  ORF g.80943 m.80943 type:complete len:642 (-) comp14680_c0_seq1:372-2297(-)
MAAALVSGESRSYYENLLRASSANARNLQVLDELYRMRLQVAAAEDGGELAAELSQAHHLCADVTHPYVSRGEAEYAELEAQADHHQEHHQQRQRRRRHPASVRFEGDLDLSQAPYRTQQASEHVAGGMATSSGGAQGDTGSAGVHIQWDGDHGLTVEQLAMAGWEDVADGVEQPDPLRPYRPATVPWLPEPDEEYRANYYLDHLWDGFDPDAETNTVIDDDLGASSSDGYVSDGNKGTRQKRPRDRWQWSAKTTVPKPFKLLQRQSRKSRSERLLEEELREKQEAEEAHLKVKFKARPMPESTTKPLYREMAELGTYLRANRGQGVAAEHKQTKPKPFAFAEREEQRRKEKAAQAAAEKQAAAELQRQRAARKVFRATPAPRDILDPQVTERHLEAEEYRKLRSKMRAHQKLQEAKTPFSERDHQGRSPQRRDRGHEEETFHPKINHRVPDFDLLQRRARAELELQKSVNRRATVAKPFSLRTEKRVANRPPPLPEDEGELREQRWPFTGQRGPTSPHPLGPKAKAYLAIGKAASQPTARSTKATTMRQDHVRRTLDEQEMDAVLAGIRMREERDKKAETQRRIAKQMYLNDKSAQTRLMTQLKLQEAKEQQRRHEERYRDQLQQLDKKLQQRPLLIDTV